MLIKYQQRQQQQQHRGKQVNAAAIKYIKKRDKVIQSVFYTGTVSRRGSTESGGLGIGRGRRVLTAQVCQVLS